MADGHYDSVDTSIKSEKEAKVYEKLKYGVVAKCFDIEAGKPIVILNEQEAIENGIFPGQRVALIRGSKETVAIVDVSSEMVRRGEAGLFKEIQEVFGVCSGKKLYIKQIPLPKSIEAIIKKIDGKQLTGSEFDSFITDLMQDRISEAEISAFLVAAHIRGLVSKEVVGLTKAMVGSGSSINFTTRYVVDKHSIGGVAGNRTTMLIVPIMAAAGCYMPKTSSRAITSPSGTADTMEVLAPVEFSLSDLKKFVSKTRGAIVWGGGVNIAPADDKMIAIRRPLRLDPRGVMMASILAKKKAVDAHYLLIDIPVGRGAKVEDLTIAKELGNDFKKVAENLGMKTEVILTDGSEPIGNGIGPTLECIDVLKVLEQKKDAPRDLRDKSLMMAGKLLELCGKAKKGAGYSMASKILTSGKALKKMKEIIEAQGGNPRVTSSKLSPGNFTYDVISKKTGRIEHIDNKGISRIARAAGAPHDKGAGVYLYKVKGDVVKKGEKLLTIYAENEEKLSFAIKFAETAPPIIMEKMLLGSI